jgi:hypothetical protein
VSNPDVPAFFVPGSEKGLKHGRFAAAGCSNCYFEPACFWAAELLDDCSLLPRVIDPDSLDMPLKQFCW